MPRKASGKIKNETIRLKQNNGDINIYARQSRYDPDKRHNVSLGSVLIAKIPKGTDKPVPTRPKRLSEKELANPRAINGDLEQYAIEAARALGVDYIPFSQRAETARLQPASAASNAGRLSAMRLHVGMMDIIDYIGRTSGIDEALYSVADKGTAQKIISIARYWFAEGGNSLPRIKTWQMNHRIPYEHGISEDVYHDLFVYLGRGTADAESIQQNFFQCLCMAGDGTTEPVIALDASSKSTYSGNQLEARYGYNKDGDGLPVVKFIMLYSLTTGMPIAFAKEAGNIPDVLTIHNALVQLSALGISKAVIVTDNGYWSPENIAEYFVMKYDFITKVQTRLAWVNDEIQKHAADFDAASNCCPFDVTTHAATVVMTQEFPYARKYGNTRKGIKAGDVEMLRRRIYLHIYFDTARKQREDFIFDKELNELRLQLESGIPLDTMTENARKKAGKYLKIKEARGKVAVTYKDSACKAARKLHGYTALISNCEKDKFTALQHYRKRENIEDVFEEDKQHNDGAKPRVWYSDTLDGRMFVQFVAQCYRDAFAIKVNGIRKRLGIPNGDTKHDNKKTLQNELSLRNWLNNRSYNEILQWFDVVEERSVSDIIRKKRWNTETTARDKLFLEKLGIQPW